MLQDTRKCHGYKIMALIKWWLLACGVIVVLATTACGRDTDFKTVSTTQGKNSKITFLVQDREQCSNKLFFKRDSLAEKEHYIPLSRNNKTTVETDSIFGSFVVTLNIEDTQPSDAGFYQCRFECSGFNSSQFYKLRVYHQPGPATCDWVQKGSPKYSSYFEYSLLKCTARQGYPRGSIICYTVGKRHIGAYSPVLVTGVSQIISQFWLQKSVPIHCCSVNRKYTKTFKFCTDFKWVGLFEASSASETQGGLSIHSNIPHPSLPLRTFTQSKFFSTIARDDNLLTDPIRTANNSIRYIIIIFCSVIISLVIVLVFFMFYSSKKHFFKTLKMDIKTHDRMQLCFFLLFILCLQFNNSTLLSFHEKDDAEIVFQYYDLNNTDVSLHVTNRPMFYHSGNMSMVGLTPKQHGRFSVDEGPVHKGEHSHITVHMIRVKIRNATREDAGTYICEIHKNGEKLDKLTKKIGLQVEFSPGKATCKIEDSFGEMNGVWVRVHCKAPLGSLHGFIDCYQDGEKMPPWTRPVQDRKTLEETLWIKRAHFAHCCTSNYERPTERCSCKDFGWDPIIGIIPQDKIDPCGITQVESNREPTSTKTLGSHSSASNQPLTYASTTTASEVEDRHTNSISDSSTWTVVVTVISVLLMIIVLLVLYLVALRKGLKADICQVKEKDSKTTQTERYKKCSESENENKKCVDKENKEVVDKKIHTKAYAQALDSDEAAGTATTIRTKYIKNRAPQTTV